MTDYESESDEDLMARFYACDNNAFDQIEKRWRRPLYAYFRLCLTCRDRDRDRAGDLTQATLFNLCRTKDSRTRYTPEKGPFRTYMFAIARNVHNDAHRKDQRNPVGPLPASSNWRLSVVPMDVPDIEALIMQMDLLECIQGLPEKEREVITLCYFGGLSLTEIAQVLEVSVGYISQIRTSALLRLRECLSGKG